MLADTEHGMVVLSSSESELAQNYRQEYMQRHCLNKESTDPLAAELLMVPVDECQLACSALEAARISQLATASNSFHLGRYRKYSDDIDRSVDALGAQAYSNTAMLDREANLAAEAEKATVAKHFYENVGTMLLELSQPVESRVSA